MKLLKTRLGNVGDVNLLHAQLSGADPGLLAEGWGTDIIIFSILTKKKTMKF